jgi:Leucine Rich repeat
LQIRHRGFDSHRRLSSLGIVLSGKTSLGGLFKVIERFAFRGATASQTSESQLRHSKNDAQSIGSVPLRSRLLRLPAVGDNAAMPTEPPKTDPPTHKRRWFQFSLRALMIFVICVIPCALLRNKVERKRREMQAVYAITNLGGHVGFDYQGGDVNRPPGPEWLRWLLGQDFFVEVDFVFFDRPIADTELENVKGFSQLKSLDVEFANVTDAGLVNIKGLTKLQKLALGGRFGITRITDAGLENLKELTALQDLDLKGTKITDAGLKHLRGLTQLKKLDVADTQLTDAGLVNFKELTGLEKLCLGRCKITDAGLENVKGLGKIQDLELWETNVGDLGMENLTGLTALRYVDLSGTRVTESGVKDLQRASPNCTIRH